MAKRLILPGFTVVLGITIFIVYYVFSDGASELQASYPPFAYPNPTGWPTGTAASGSGATPSPMLFVPGMHKSAIGEPGKGIKWDIEGGPAVLDAVPFNLGWYQTQSVYPPDDHPTYHWPATVGGEFIPFDPCIVNPTSYPPHLSKDYTGYMLFLNEPDNDQDPIQCGYQIDANPITAAEIYSDLVTKYPNAKLIGPNLTYARYNESITGFLEAWRAEVISMGLPLPHGYGIHLYPKPLQETASEWTQAYCDKLYEWGELDKELWVTEFGWSNGWVFPSDPVPTQQATINENIDEQFGFFETGLTAGTPTPGAEPNCQITRYAWYTNRIRIGLTVTPDVTPTAPVGYTDLYWYWSLTRSYTGNAYVDFGNLSTPTPTP